VEDVPLSVGLVFDVSGSMDNKLRTSREAAIQFLKTMNPEDEVLLVAFGDRANLAAGFTNNGEEIRKKLMALEPWGTHRRAGRYGDGAPGDEEG
jgi:Ca-activated chloride channel family protein